MRESFTQIFGNPLWVRHTELIISNRDRSLYHCLGINNKGSCSGEKTEEPEIRATT